jgi:hypothetical protein
MRRKCVPLVNTISFGIRHLRQPRNVHANEHVSVGLCRKRCGPHPGSVCCRGTLKPCLKVGGNKFGSLPAVTLRLHLVCKFPSAWLPTSKQSSSPALMGSPPTRTSRQLKTNTLTNARSTSLDLGTRHPSRSWVRGIPRTQGWRVLQKLWLPHTRGGQTRGRRSLCCRHSSSHSQDSRCSQSGGMVAEANSNRPRRRDLATVLIQAYSALGFKLYGWCTVTDHNYGPYEWKLHMPLPCKENSHADGYRPYSKGTTYTHSMNL